MAVPPTLVSSTASSFTTSTSPKAVEITVAAGDLIVVGAMSESAAATLGISGGSLTWTQQQYVSASGYNDVGLWTAQATSATTFSISVSNTGTTEYFGYAATVWRNHGGVGASSKSNKVGDAETGIATTAADSALVVFGAEYTGASLSSRAWHTSPFTFGSELFTGQQSGKYSWFIGTYADTNATNSGNVGLYEPSSITNSTVALEIKGTATGAPSTTVTLTGIASGVAFGTPEVTYGIATTVPTGIPSGLVFGSPIARVDTWRQIIEGPSWKAAVTAHQRTVGFRAEMVDKGDNHVLDVPITSGTIDFDGEAAEQWACQITVPGEEWIARNPKDPLDPRSGLRCRLWWRLLINGGFVEVPVGTFVLEDPRITDNGAMPVTSVRGRDPLTIIRRAGYGSLVISVGGLTVPAALSRIMEAIAPTTPFRIDSTSTVTLPATYELTGSDPLDDMVTIASQASLNIRTDREGRVICAPNPTSQTIRADWQEGPDCPVTDLARDVNTSQMLNSVTVVSTNPEVIPPISVTVEDDDPFSPTFVGGVWGRRATTIRTDSIATEAGATSMARGILNGRRRPQEEIRIEVPPRGDLGYRDKVALAREMSGVANTYRIASWNLTFGNAKEAPATMGVTMISRTLV